MKLSLWKRSGSDLGLLCDHSKHSYFTRQSQSIRRRQKFCYPLARPHTCISSSQYTAVVLEQVSRRVVSEDVNRKTLQQWQYIILLVRIQTTILALIRISIPGKGPTYNTALLDPHRTHDRSVASEISLFRCEYVLTHHT